MIVRISGEGQYRLSDSDAAHLNELESGVISIVESENEDGFASAFATMLDYVRAQGAPLGDDELDSSDVILPPADISFHEAGREFTGEGLIPD